MKEPLNLINTPDILQKVSLSASLNSHAYFMDYDVVS